MKKKLPVIILLLLVIPAVLPLLHPGFFQTDDGEWMIIRLSAFFAALREGQIPVRFIERLNFGYGYPVAEFLYPGIMYAGSILHLLKIGFVDAIKIIMGISLVGSAIFTYLWLSRFFSKTASIVGALFALYLPYHLYDAYSRGSVGELFALLWVPFILYSIERKNVFLLTLGISLLLLSHNTLAVLFLPLIFIYALVRRTIILRHLFGSFLVGFGLAAFFIIPAIFELHNTIFSQIAVSDPLKYFAGPMLIGYGSLFLLFVTGIALFTKKKVFKEYRSVTLYFFIVSLITVFLSSSFSAFLWHSSVTGFIQFPFRLLSVLTMSLAFLAAAVINEYNSKRPWVISIILLTMLIVFAYPFSKPQGYFDKGEGYYFTNDASTTVQDEYMPKWVKDKPLKRPDQKVLIIKGKGTVSNITSNNKKTVFMLKNNTHVLVQINTIYWPGWGATVDGKNVTLQYNNPKGVIQIAVPTGEHQIILQFTETPIRLFADIVSILSGIVFIIFFVKSRRV